ITSIRSVQSKSDSQNNLIANMSAITSELGVMILLASVLSIAVIYNISAISIFERQRELATLKVLGFKDNEVKRLIFNENYIITAFGTLLGLPMGQWLGSSMMASYQTDAYTIPFITGTNTFVIAALLTLLFTYIANLTLRNKIKDISMVEVLKSNE
ncbi:MAG TPA: ABC transporter permease, partial [Clostridia bacterium]